MTRTHAVGVLAIVIASGAATAGGPTVGGHATAGTSSKASPKSSTPEASAPKHGQASKQMQDQLRQIASSFHARLQAIQAEVKAKRQEIKQLHKEEAMQIERVEHNYRARVQALEPASGSVARPGKTPISPVALAISEPGEHLARSHAGVAGSPGRQLRQEKVAALNQIEGEFSGRVRSIEREIDMLWREYKQLRAEEQAEMNKTEAAHEKGRGGDAKLSPAAAHHTDRATAEAKGPPALGLHPTIATKPQPANTPAHAARPPATPTPSKAAAKPPAAHK